MRSALPGMILLLPLAASAARAVCAPDPGGDTVVELQTSMGTICVGLFPEAPGFTETVPNFLGYVNRQDYDGTFVHRSVQEFVIQGGGFEFEGGEYRWLCSDIESHDCQPGSPDRCCNVPNEFAGISSALGCGPGQPEGCNVRGTLAMAKIGGDANSATSQWFVNLDDNSFLDSVQSGEFTIFGRVVTGMDVVDAIAGLPQIDGELALRSDLRSVFSELPLTSQPPASCYDLGDMAAVLAPGGFLCDGTSPLQPDPFLTDAFFPYFVSRPCLDTPEPCPGEPQNLNQCGIFRGANGGLFFKAEASQPSSCGQRASSDTAQMALDAEVSQRLVEITRAFVVPEPGALLSRLASLAALALLARRRGRHASQRR
jgi:cyclophilin family peptidyl-prolyl cis-trans isomerase